MRALLVLLMLTGVALAKPTIAVAPIEGDSGNKVADVIAEVAGEEARVIGPDKTEKARDKLGMSSELDRKDLTKLRSKLDADFIISGKLEKDGKTRTLELGVTAKGRKTQTFTLTFKNADSDKFKRELREELAKRTSSGGGEPEDDEPKRLSSNDDDDDDKAKKKKKKKRRGGDDDDDEEEDDDGDGPGVKQKRHPVTQVALRVWAGASFGRRTLTNDSSATNKPPSVGTAAPSGRIEGEIYPAAFSTLKGAAAGIGVFGRYERAFGVKINVPLEPDDSAIAQANFTVGARYRIAFGSSTIALGVAYAGRQYIADRSVLDMPSQLDMPDVKYKAVAPGAIARFPVTPTIGAFVGADVLLMMSTGAIQKSEQYGPADIIGFELEGGLDVAFGVNYGLHLAADFSQIGFKFAAKPGTMAAVRGVSAATDRTYSVLAAFAVMY